MTAYLRDRSLIRMPSKNSSKSALPPQQPTANPTATAPRPSESRSSTSNPTSSPTVSTASGISGISFDRKTMSSDSLSSLPTSSILSPPQLSFLLLSNPHGLTATLAALLQDDVTAGDTRPAADGATMTVFHALEPPSISVRDYVYRLSKYAFCSPSCLITAMYYMCRIVDNHPNLALTSLTFHRLLITSLVLACKYLDDMNYNLAYYAKVGGLPTKELANLEVHMLGMLNFHLGIPIPLFQHLESTLVSRVIALAHHAPTEANDTAIQLANKAIHLLDPDIISRFSSSSASASSSPTSSPPSASSVSLITSSVQEEESGRRRTTEEATSAPSNDDNTNANTKGEDNNSGGITNPAQSFDIGVEINTNQNVNTTSRIPHVSALLSRNCSFHNFTNALLSKCSPPRSPHASPVCSNHDSMSRSSSTSTLDSPCRMGAADNANIEDNVDSNVKVVSMGNNKTVTWCATVFQTNTMMSGGGVGNGGGGSVANAICD